MLYGVFLHTRHHFVVDIIRSDISSDEKKIENIYNFVEPIGYSVSSKKILIRYKNVVFR